MSDSKSIKWGTHILIDARDDLPHTTAADIWRHRARAAGHTAVRNPQIEVQRFDAGPMATEAQKKTSLIRVTGWVD